MTTTSSPFDRFHVVLVEPAESRNVGSVARAMRNLGFRHLHLVTPRRYDPARARVTACSSAQPLLDSLVIHERFEEALFGMEEVVGFALRAGESSHFVTLPDWATELPARQQRTTALIFGPEDNGLRNEHLEQCRWVVRIPSASEFPSFNLAQSVLLALYEITKAFPTPGSGAPPARSATPDEDAPTWNAYYQLDRLLDSVMSQSGFVRPGTPAPVPGVVRNLFRRLPLSGHEMRLLLALFGRLNRTLLLRPGRDQKACDENDR
jgi:TrmH family RNA methyltransferase